jgi:lysophospholipase L1-like esterase
MWPTAESFAGLPVINRGFGGSHVSDVNYYAERIVLKYAPRVIVFYAGDNDIAAGESPRQVVDDVRAFVDLVHRRLPKTRIVCLPIKPSLARWQWWPQMSEVNSAVESMSASDDLVAYVDTATPMLGPDGRPRPELFLDDGLHLNARGYSLWNEVLRPTLERPSAVDSSLP